MEGRLFASASRIDTVRRLWMINAEKQAVSFSFFAIIAGRLGFI
jgi:hypothetical protein